MANFIKTNTSLTQSESLIPNPILLIVMKFSCLFITVTVFNTVSVKPIFNMSVVSRQEDYVRV